MKFLLSILLLTPLVARAAAPVVTNIANFPSVSVAYTNYVGVAIVTNQISVGTDQDWASILLQIRDGFTNHFGGAQYSSLGAWDTNHGGLNIVAEGDGVVSPGLIFNGQISTNTGNEPMIEFSGSEVFPGGDASMNKTLFGFDNDFAHLVNGGRWMLQCFESHGTYSGGYPDSVGYIGINAIVPDANLHVVNSATVNDDRPKTNVVSIFEGRSDQIGDLAQWKLTGGPTLSSIPKSGGFASFSTDSAIAISTTGWTNTFGKNAVVRFDGTAMTYTVYNNAGTPIYTNTVALGHSTELLQASGKIIITAGTGVSGVASPF